MTSCSKRRAERPVAGHDEVRLLAELVHRDQRVERAVGPLLLDHVPDESDEPHVGGQSELLAQLARRDLAVDGDERLGIAEVRDRPDRAR